MSKGINWGEGGKSSVVGMNGLGYFLCEAALFEALVKKAKIILEFLFVVVLFCRGCAATGNTVMIVI